MDVHPLYKTVSDSPQKSILHFNALTKKKYRIERKLYIEVEILW